ncbi:MAE_28990/MAE_18760 family HEPN-like nuclease [Adlercreutzia sp. ZJ242]|uniref:MAE_28990/MAE_18760 family HEPN-like nuclease n=1 Tax=Adlercreutzia sp. ZJ242 TaxID=2709409 RepID=UPI0013EC7A11|nr:MAE_28990/MAE_18760 family HEPN-like nuclease [Adlercreutzia sp. ZJ242]
MDTSNYVLGYEQLYQERLDETKSMITLATLLDFFDQGIGNGVDYQFVMNKARVIAESANHGGLPSDTPDVTLVASVIRSNVKIMIYNIIEFSVTSLIQAIYDRLDDESCSYVDVSAKLRILWHHTRMRKLRDPNASNETAERISKELLDEAIANVTIHISSRQTLIGGNLDGEEIFKLFDKHGISIHAAKSGFRSSELKDIRDRRNDLAHGAVSFVDAGNQVTTAELAELINNVDSFLTQLRLDVMSYLDSGAYRASEAV